MTICCLNGEYGSVFHRILSNICFLLADCYLWKQYLIEGGKDDSVIASNQARNGTCRFKKAMMMKMMMAMIRDVRGQHFSLRTGRDNYFGAERGSGQNPQVRARQRSFPFRAGQKQCEPIIKCQFQGLFEQMSIFLSFMLVSLLGRGRAGRSSDENLTRLSRLFPLGGVGCAS